MPVLRPAFTPKWRTFLDSPCHNGGIWRIATMTVASA